MQSALAELLTFDIHSLPPPLTRTPHYHLGRGREYGGMRRSPLTSLTAAGHCRASRPQRCCRPPEQCRHLPAAAVFASRVAPAGRVGSRASPRGTDEREGSGAGPRLAVCQLRSHLGPPQRSLGVGLRQGGVIHDGHSSAKGRGEVVAPARRERKWWRNTSNARCM